MILAPLGNYLGARLPDDARDMVHLGIIFDFVYGAAMGAFLLLVLRPVRDWPE